MPLHLLAARGVTPALRLCPRTGLLEARDGSDFLSAGAEQKMEVPVHPEIQDNIERKTSSLLMKTVKTLQIGLSIYQATPIYINMQLDFARTCNLTNLLA